MEKQIGWDKSVRAAFFSGILLALVLAGLLLCARASAQTAHNDEFVQRAGTTLTLGGEPFRYSGPNIEWLGVEGYGPLDPIGPRYPSHFEVDDALDTAKAMGARVIRSQTLGDSVGCDLCMEPKVGEFNPEAFKHIDYAVKSAHDRGLRLILTLTGDCADCVLSGAGEYFKDRGVGGFKDFFTDPVIIAKFEKHIAALLNHKSTITGIALKDDPTIMAWENCNACGVLIALTSPGQSFSPYIAWVDTIGAFIKSIDKKHLYEDNTGFFIFDPTGAALDAKTSDIVTSEYYPHWDTVFNMGQKTTAETFPKHAAMVTGKGKVYVVNEYGWDVTDWATQADLEKVLKAIAADPKISGDDFWALQAHVDIYGWQPLPVNVPNAAYSKMSESGQWWSLYYGGITTLINSKEDMAGRAELLRSHAFIMAGGPVPPHAIPPAPVVTTQGLGLITWRGSAGAVSYSIERKDNDASPWKTICDQCATDESTPWIDPKPAQGLFEIKYRVIAYNADGKPSAPSPER